MQCSLFLPTSPQATSIIKFLFYSFSIFCISMNNEISSHFHFPKNGVISNIVLCVCEGRHVALFSLL